jgi:hypothetical protein
MNPKIRSRVATTILAVGGMMTVALIITKDDVTNVVLLISATCALALAEWVYPELKQEGTVNAICDE